MKEKHMSKAKFKVGDEVLIRGRVVQDGGCGNAYLIRTADECETWMFARACESTEIVPRTYPPNTVQVRIAVAVGGDGSWEARPINGIEDEESARMFAADDLLDGQPGFCRVSIITAHVFLPEQPAEVEGVVE